MRRLIILFVGTPYAFALPAAAQEKLPGVGEMCIQGQCGPGAYCDFSALPNPTCRAVPLATPPAPVAAPAPVPAPAPAPILISPTPPAPIPAPAFTAPAPAPPPPAPAPAEQPTDDLIRIGLPSDDSPSAQSLFHRHFGFGYLGTRQVPLLDLGAQANVPVSVSVLGVRYWYWESVGFDAGIGVQWNSGTAEQEVGDQRETTDIPATIGTVIQVGVPWAITSHKELSIILAPQLSFAFSNRNTAATPNNIAESGIGFGVGARAGAELHLGSLGLPQLAIESTLAAGFSIDVARAAQGNVAVSLSETNFLLPDLGSIDAVLANLSLRYYL